MREIKFRVFNKTQGKMSEPFTLEDLMCVEVPLLSASVMSDEIEWIQFTGLLDKQGKEIYEGDIVRHENLWLATVGFEAGCFYWQAEVYKPQAKDWQDATWRNFEVIGNIYENAELLK